MLSLKLTRQYKVYLANKIFEGLWEKLIFTQIVEKFFRLLWKPKVRYLVHRSPPLSFVLSRINLANILISYFFKDHFNITITSTPKSSFKFFVRNFCTHTSSLPCVLHAHLSHTHWFGRPNNILWRVQLKMQFFIFIYFVVKIF